MRAEAPNDVITDIGTNDVCNGCIAVELAEGIVIFALKLTTIPPVLQVVICQMPHKSQNPAAVLQFQAILNQLGTLSVT